MQYTEYEHFVVQELRQYLPGAIIKHDQILPGYLSGAERQFDILIECSPQLKAKMVAVECKNYSRPITVKQVEAFIGQLKDVGLDAGIMFTTKGYSKAAFKRATNDEFDIELDVISIDSSQEFQAIAGRVWNENFSVAAGAPIGWCVDDHSAIRMNRWLISYERAKPIESVLKLGEWIEVELIPRVGNPSDIIDVDAAMKDYYDNLTSPICSSKSSEIDLRKHERTILRTTYRHEHVSFSNLLIQFDSVIASVNLYSPEDRLSKNLRKLHFFAEKLSVEKVIKTEK